MVPVLHPDGQVDERLVKNVFQVQQEVVDILIVVEEELMRQGKLQSLNKQRRTTGFQAGRSGLMGAARKAISSHTLQTSRKH